MLLDESPMGDENTDQERDIWSAIRYLDPDNKDKESDRATIAAVLALLLMILILWILFYLRLNQYD